MTIAALVEAVLAADVTLTTALTGGVHSYQDTKRLGLSKTTVPTAYDASGVIKPCALVKQRSRVPTSAIKDAPSQKTSEAAIIEIWLYSDGNTTPPETAANRVYVLLHEQYVSAGRLKWVNTIEDFRDPAMDYANVIRLDFEYVGMRG
jgi:hypothetical protein